MKKFLLIAIIYLLPTAIFSQALSKKEKIQNLMELSGSGKLGVQVVTSMITSMQKLYPDIPQKFWDDFAKEIKPDDLINLIVPVYDKYYTEEDIDQLIAFYNTPVGKKMTEVLPMITQESMAAGQVWGRKIAEKVAERLKEDRY